MKLKDLTLKQIKAVESVFYMDVYHLDDNTFFEMICLHITDCWDENPDVEIDDEVLHINDYVAWIEDKIKEGL